LNKSDDPEFLPNSNISSTVGPNGKDGDVIIHEMHFIGVFEVTHVLRAL
jgi:hypothetical protein